MWRLLDDHGPLLWASDLDLLTEYYCITVSGAFRGYSSTNAESKSNRTIVWELDKYGRFATNWNDFECACI